MRFTNRDIANDVDFVIQELKNTEVEIPSFWQCAWPGALVFIFLASWQILFGFLHTHSVSEALDGVCASILFWFMAFLSITQSRSRYLCLPTKVQHNSLIIQLLKKKARIYGLLWGTLCLLGGMTLFPITFFVILISSVLLLFIYSLDMSRYDLSLLSAAIAAWRNGGDMNAVQQLAQPAAAPGATHHTEQ